MTEPAFRRRILIEPEAGSVRAELEDDWHRMVVTLRHEHGIAIDIAGEMIRWPWTTCRGAIAQLAATFAAQPLSAFPAVRGKSRNCTHLFDLAVFAAAHADETTAIAYDISVADPVDGLSRAEIARNGISVVTWSLQARQLAGPHAGTSLAEMGDWIERLDECDREAARILRWASILALGRTMGMPAGMSATVFAAGNCFTFQPDMAREAVRRDDAARDFTGPDRGPMADRGDLFPDKQ